MTDQPPLSAIKSRTKDIKIKPDESKDNFGDELFEQLIINFVEKDYEEKKTLIEEALQAKDNQKLYFIVHSFKTTARMLCIEDFAQECQEIQDYSHSGQGDWEKLDELLPLFLQDFEAVFLDAKEIYDKDYKPQQAEILPEFTSSLFFPPQNTVVVPPEKKPSQKSILREDTFDSFKSKEIREESENEKKLSIFYLIKQNIL